MDQDQHLVRVNMAQTVMIVDHDRDQIAMIIVRSRITECATMVDLENSISTGVHMEQIVTTADQEQSQMCCARITVPFRMTVSVKTVDLDQ